MLSWHYLTRAQYDAAQLSDKSSDKLFFLTDTKEIYRGTTLFTEALYTYSGAEPAEGLRAIGKIYVNTDTLEGKVWDGSAWTTVIKPVASIVTAGETNPVSGSAVAAYVSEAIAGVTGSGELVKNISFKNEGTTRALVVEMADNTSHEVALKDMAIDLAYNATTGLLQVVDADGVTGTGINLDLERFVTAAEYDDASKTIILYFDNETTKPLEERDHLEIPVGDLVDTYTAAAEDRSKGAKITLTGNEFAVEAIVSSTGGNIISIDEYGLYAAATDISMKADKVVPATANSVALLSADGNLADSAVQVGGAALAGTSSTILATEAAVAAVRTALQANIDEKMAKVDAGHADELLVATADGEAALSGKKLGGQTLATNPDAATLATEAAVKTYVDTTSVAKADVVVQAALSASSAVASDANPVTEKAVLGLLEWKQGV